MEAVMGGQSRREYVERQRVWYGRASRREKGRILDEGCRLFGVHRKSLIRAFGRGAPHRRARRGRRPQYGSQQLLKALTVIWLKARQPCGKRLKVVVAQWFSFYEANYEKLDPAVRDLLLAASPATLDRLLRPVRASRRKGLSATRSVKRLEGQIPIRTNFRDVDGPGTFEADTVAHCGQTTAGKFVWTVTLTDIWSGWTENRAVWNKNLRQIVSRLREIEERLPFDIVAFDSDNGGEFINYQLLRYFHDRADKVNLTRSRPCHKNDQAHVEQKQWTHVRQLLGYDRFEDRRLVEMINDLYRNEWRALQNFFLPTMQLLSKTRQGAKVRRHHSTPATPYQRLLACPKVSEEAKEQLRREFQTLDPFDLDRQIEAKLRPILRLARSQQKAPTQNHQKGDTQTKRQKTATKTQIAA